MGKLCRIGSHEADPSAHTKNLHEVLRTGDNYVLPLAHGSAKIQITADRLYGGLFVISRTMTFDRIAIQVTTLAAGKSIRLGIYNVGTNLYPGTLVLDAGVVSAAATGVKTITISQQLARGIYFTAFISDGTPTLECPYAVVAPLGGHPTNFAVTNFAGWYKDDSYGALPDPLPAGGSLDSGYAIAARLRPASMD